MYTMQLNHYGTHTHTHTWITTHLNTHYNYGQCNAIKSFTDMLFESWVEIWELGGHTKKKLGLKTKPWMSVCNINYISIVSYCKNCLCSSGRQIVVR